MQEYKDLKIAVAGTGLSVSVWQYYCHNIIMWWLWM